jgi:hypothetical protein
LRKVFLLLRKELKESDIPSHTTIRNRIKDTYEKHLEELSAEMQVNSLLPLVVCHDILRFLQKSVGKISFTTDAWSDPNRTPFMAVTAHWIEALPATAGSNPKLRLRADLIGFHRVPGRHTGVHFAECFVYLTNRLNITNKV